MDEKYSKALSFLIFGIILLGTGVIAYIYGSNENPTLDFEILRQQDILFITSYIVMIVSFILITIGIVSILHIKN